MHDAPSTQAGLVVRLRNADDEAAWADFIDVYEPLIYRLVRSRGLQDADAREVTQEVLWSVSRAVDSWDPDPERGSFRAWLATIARNLTVNYLTRTQRPTRGTGRTSFHELLKQHPDVATDDSQEFDLELGRRLFVCASDRVRVQVRAATWEAFWRTTIDDRSAADTAEELGLTIGAVYIARSRVMFRLRKEVERLSITEE